MIPNVNVAADTLGACSTNFKYCWEVSHMIIYYISRIDLHFVLII